MKLGTQTGSVMNHIMSRQTLNQPKPEVGMGATVLMWTDRSAATIVSVEEVTGKRYQYVIGVQGDVATCVAGSTHDGSAEYAYSPNPKAAVYLFASEREGSRWQAVRRNEAGRLVKNGERGLRIGERDEYRDPSF